MLKEYNKDNKTLTSEVILMRDWMKETRTKKGLTQQFVADKLGITKQYYQQIEDGKRQVDLSTSLVLSLSNVFEISPIEIMNFENN